MSDMMKEPTVLEITFLFYWFSLHEEKKLLNPRRDWIRKAWLPFIVFNRSWSGVDLRGQICWSQWDEPVTAAASWWWITYEGDMRKSSITSLPSWHNQEDNNKRCKPWHSFSVWFPRNLFNRTCASLSNIKRSFIHPPIHPHLTNWVSREFLNDK